MSRRHHSIPSQRLPLSVSSATTSRTTPAKPARSRFWAVGITGIGWILLVYPAALLALISYILITGSTDDPATASSVIAGLFGMIAVASMAAAPLFTGLALTTRRRGLWIAAIITWVFSIAAVVYVIVEWLVPLA
ncbi:hypothetical protein [Arthrobacter cryoconiti]|uniref:Uncharacterized protein n=1 Tax=Arthrobacter cryoconiti TaxID=748907 RepID=A0ABV8R4K8_9MICC|nr:hypothetical protein [Arthrobacter cryoconiti]MCC9066882.1 hypothetical protein [Arthrobacter cryoconiti]